MIILRLSGKDKPFRKKAPQCIPALRSFPRHMTEADMVIT